MREISQPMRQAAPDEESRDGLAVSTEHADELPPPPSRPVPRRPAVADQLPVIPGYDIDRVLGRGGMGVVYLARQVSLNRPVALKILIAGAHQRQRFRAEVEAVAALRHPNIVQIHEVGECDGVPYCALEYLDGGTLQDAAAGRPLPPRDAAACVETLARAVQFAHEHGIVHRDLKPANVLLASGASDGPGLCTTPGPSLAPLAKIADFGLAKRLAQESGLTGTGAILGTPSYMAPEQAEGGSRDVGPPADVWALGAILYELLTGRPPFQGVSAAETMLMVVNNEPVPAARLQPQLPRDLDTVCRKCLEKDPRRRYGSAAALADDLRRYLEGCPVTARRAGAVERAGKWARRRPAAAALIVVTAVAAGALAGLGWRHTANLNRHARELEAANASITHQRQRAEENLESAAAAVDQMLTRVGLNRLAGVARADPVRAALLEDALRFYERLLASQAADPRLQFLQAQTLERTGSILLKLGRYDPARERFDQAVALARNLPPDPPVLRLIALAHNNRGLLHGHAGQVSLAEAEHQAALDMREKLLAAAPDDPERRYDVACSCVNLALVARANRLPALGEQYLTRARAEAEALARQHPDTANYSFLLGTVMNDLGVFHLDHDRPTQAAPILDVGANAWRRLVAAHPDDVEYRAGLARCLSNLGTAWRDQGDLERAESPYREALAVRAKLASEHPDIWNFGVEHGWSLLRLGQWHRARNENELALASLSQAIERLDGYGKLPAAAGRARVPLREAYLTRGELPDAASALADLDRAVELSTSDQRPATRLARARVIARTGDKHRAAAEADEVLAAATTGPLAFAAARVFAILGDEASAARAVALLTKALDAGFFNAAGRAMLERDADLSTLRGRPDYAAFAARLSADGTAVSQPP